VQRSGTVSVVTPPMLLYRCKSAKQRAWIFLELTCVPITVPTHLLLLLSVAGGGTDIITLVRKVAMGIGTGTSGRVCDSGSCDQGMFASLPS
jgi:hypothetical protein